MKRMALGMAAALLFAAPVLAQTSQSVTNPSAPAATNPKNDEDSCTKPGKPCTTQNVTPASTSSDKKATEKKAEPAAMTKTPPAATPAPTNCTKQGTAAPTPSSDACDSNSGIHEGGPFGH